MWGAAWLPEEGGHAFACAGAPDAATLPAGRLEGAGADGEWRLADGETSVAVSPLAPEISLLDGAGFEQLCRARGRVVVDGAEHEVDCLARRAERTGGAGGLDSVRDVCALFEPSTGLAVVALRPRSTRGHDRDSVSAAVLDAEEAAAVADPRFSTTYGAGGHPLRSSFELWIGEAEDEFPRRAAGEAVGPLASSTAGALTVQASLFRWFSRGREGAGVYILARPA